MRAMTLEVEYVDEIPEGDGPYEKGLWAEARHWVDWLIRVYGNVREIALVGLPRRSALRCKNWLWSIEGIVRRLVIAAALALDPASLKPVSKRSGKANPTARPEQAEAEEPAEPERPPSAFRILAVSRTGKAHTPSAAPRGPSPPSPEHRHLPFPSDSLLALGAPEARRRGKGPPAKHRLNPLDRRGRVSRWDPDYKTDPVKAAESYRRGFFGPFPVLPDRFSRPPRERRHRDIHDPYYRTGADVPEFRRIAEEWNRVIPAPDLAGRIMALHRVMQAPERWIKRIARQLLQRQRLVELLKDAPYPNLEKPRRDKTPEPPGLLCLSMSHARLLGLDTS
jgi:hypothetical protein